MPELTALDVTTYTKGRLADQDENERLLNAALAAARRYCGWYVSPVQTGAEFTIDGSGGHLLGLPTMKLVELTSITEHGEDVDLSTVHYSIPGGPEMRRGVVEKARWHRWSHHYGAIAVTMTHGLSEADAADFREAVLRLVDAMSRDSSSSRDGSDMKRKRVDVIEYEWFEGIIASDTRLRALFSEFRLLPLP